MRGWLVSLVACLAVSSASPAGGQFQLHPDDETLFLSRGVNPHTGMLQLDLTPVVYPHKGKGDVLLDETSGASRVLPRDVEAHEILSNGPLPERMKGTVGDPESECFDPRAVNEDIAHLEDEEEVLIVDKDATGGARAGRLDTEGLTDWEVVSKKVMAAGMSTMFIGAEVLASFPPIPQLAPVLRVEVGLKLEHLTGDTFSPIAYRRSSGEVRIAVALGNHLFSVRAFGVGKSKLVTQCRCASVGSALRSTIYEMIGRAVLQALAEFKRGVSLAIDTVSNESGILSSLSRRATLRGRVAERVKRTVDDVRDTLFGYLRDTGDLVSSATAGGDHRDDKRSDLVHQEVRLPRSMDQRRRVWRSMYFRVLTLKFAGPDDKIFTAAQLRERFPGKAVTPLVFLLGNVCLCAKSGTWVNWAARKVYYSVRSRDFEADQIVNCALEFGSDVQRAHAELLDFLKGNAYIDEDTETYADPREMVASIRDYVEVWERFSDRVSGTTLPEALTSGLVEMRDAVSSWERQVNEYIMNVLAEGTRVKISRSVRFGVGLKLATPNVNLEFEFTPRKLGERAVIFPVTWKPPYSSAYLGVEARAKIELGHHKIELQVERRTYEDKEYNRYRCGHEDAHVYRAKAKIMFKAPANVNAVKVMAIARSFLSENLRELVIRTMALAKGVGRDNVTGDTRSNMRVFASFLLEHALVGLAGSPLVGTSHIGLLPDVYMCQVPEPEGNGSIVRVDLRRTKFQVFLTGPLGGDALGKVFKGWGSPAGRVSNAADGTAHIRRALGIEKFEAKGGVGVLFKGIEIIPKLPEIAIMDRYYIDVEKKALANYVANPGNGPR